MTMYVRGRDQVAGMPRTITGRTNEIVDALQEPLEAIVARATAGAVLPERRQA